MTKRKIILFGGTFDPIHLGHTTVASSAADHLVAEKVLFVPANRSVLKSSYPKASNDDRLRMISLAIQDNKKFEVSDCELKKAQPSYTLDTVRQLGSKYPAGTQIYWLIGADTVDELPSWYKITELIDECNLCVMFRAGFKAPDFVKFEPLWGSERVRRLQQNVIRTPLVDISSTEIRKRLAAGRDVSDMLHGPVAEYIRKHKLYKSADPIRDSGPSC